MKKQLLIATLVAGSIAAGSVCASDRYFVSPEEEAQREKGCEGREGGYYDDNGDYVKWWRITATM